MLKILQQRFVQAMRCKQPVREWEHLFVYSNAYRETLTSQLATVFPLIKKLIGDECFACLAYDYIQEHLPYNFDLNAYGKSFVDFIANQKSVMHLQYLREVAQFEWACHEMLYQIDPALPQNKTMQFTIPLLEIIDLCNGKTDAEIDIDSGGVTITICKRGYAVLLKRA